MVIARDHSRSQLQRPLHVSVNVVDILKFWKEEMSMTCIVHAGFIIPSHSAILNLISRLSTSGTHLPVVAEKVQFDLIEVEYVDVQNVQFE